MAPQAHRQFREKFFSPAISRLTGTVLELGCGRKVANEYSSAETLVLVDRRGGPLILNPATSGAQVQAYVADAACLPFGSGAFDAIVTAFFFCCVADECSVMNEITRVCRKGGELIALEHIISPYKWVRCFQRWATPLHARLRNGCCLDRNPLAFVDSERWHIVESHCLAHSWPWMFLRAVKR